MNLQTIITDIRTRWNSVSPSTPLYLQLAPDTAQVHFAVLRMGDITAGEGDLTERDYAATARFIAYCGSDVAALGLVDSIVSAFDRNVTASLYSMQFESAAFDLEYTDTGSLWSVSVSFSLRWEG